MSEARSGWGDAERAAFWAFVRGKRAERNVKQEELARELGFDRSVVTRRLNGQIKEQPDAALLERLAEALALDAAAKAQLNALAGFPEPPKPATAPMPPSMATASDAATESAPAAARLPTSAHRLGRRLGRRALLLGVLALLVLGAGGFAWESWSRAASASLPAGGYSVTITAATRAAAPGTFVLITGTAPGVPSGIRIWTVLRAGAAYWPQRPVYRVGAAWSGYARIGGSAADSGRELQVLAVLADRDGDQALATWLQRGDQTGAYPPLAALPAGTRVGATTAVHVK